ncbi:hypothetical protein ABIA38_004316 [Embleya sp. AB8]
MRKPITMDPPPLLSARPWCRPCQNRAIGPRESEPNKPAGSA